jgi:hypothetical protein
MPLLSSFGCRSEPYTNPLWSEVETTFLSRVFAFLLYECGCEYIEKNWLANGRRNRRLNEQRQDFTSNRLQSIHLIIIAST